jgi:cytoskeleton protein RodZ
MVNSETKKEYISVGKLLKDCREKDGLSLLEISSQLNLDSRIISAIEEDDFDSLPDSTYVRGYIRGYCKILGQNADEFLDVYKLNAQRDDPEIIPEIKYPTQPSSSDKPVKVFTYLITLGLVLLVIAWWQSNFIIKNPTVVEPDQTQQIEIEVPEYSVVELMKDEQDNISLIGENYPGSFPIESTRLNENPDLMTNPTDAINMNLSGINGVDFSDNPANILFGEGEALLDLNQQISEDTESNLATSQQDQSTLTPTYESVGPDTLILNITADSWIEIFDVNKQKIHFDLGRTGNQLTLKGTAPFDVILGFAQGVTIMINDKPFDPSPYTRGGVARFTLDN